MDKAFKINEARGIFVFNCLVYYIYLGNSSDKILFLLRNISFFFTGDDGTSFLVYFESNTYDDTSFLVYFKSSTYTLFLDLF